ncbi:jg21776 [Pararge aegeria aegeria]|uniref:Jg21776 protein n=1 Tax=Pararge aegeria aegeria TaxID=348720 RepID=A0A8S4R576_9NEOP|nr:jg21776 [Pararge aegeria aegeria]
MKTFIILVTIFLVSLMVTATPIDRHHKEAGTPPSDRHVHPRFQPTKGGRPVHKDYPTPRLNVRKGEYICGNRVCKLKPGEVPEGCNGMCQYPIA